MWNKEEDLRKQLKGAAAREMQYEKALENRDEDYHMLVAELILAKRLGVGDFWGDGAGVHIKFLDIKLDKNLLEKCLSSLYTRKAVRDLYRKPREY